MKTRDISLFPLIHDYLKVYLPEQRNVSPNTVLSYRKTLEELLDYVKVREEIPLGSISFEHLKADTIFSFLEYLESGKGYSISTRNARFAAIRAFMDYAADHDVALVANLNKLKKVPFKKAASTVMVDYMSMAAVTAIIEQPDANTQKGLRDRPFIMLLHDTGARVQEALNINLNDLRLDRLPKVTLFGKGRKTHVVPLLGKTARHLKKYLSVFHVDTPQDGDVPLFYSVTHGKKQRLSDRRVRYILQKYGEQARRACSEVPENVYPYLFRHSRAMHLYQEGMDLTLVSQWLWHSQLETTQIYAHADTEHKRKAIEASTPQDNPLYSKLNSARYTVTDEETDWIKIAVFLQELLGNLKLFLYKVFWHRRIFIVTFLKLRQEMNSSIIFRDYYILVTMLTAPMPSLKEFDANGNPVYAEETRGESDIRCFQEAQEGVRAYFILG